LAGFFALLLAGLQFRVKPVDHVAGRMGAEKRQHPVEKQDKPAADKGQGRPRRENEVLDIGFASLGGVPGKAC